MILEDEPEESVVAEGALKAAFVDSAHCEEAEVSDFEEDSSLSTTETCEESSVEEVVERGIVAEMIVGMKGIVDVAESKTSESKVDSVEMKKKAGSDVRNEEESMKKIKEDKHVLTP